MVASHSPGLGGPRAPRAWDKNGPMAVCRSPGSALAASFLLAEALLARPVLSSPPVSALGRPPAMVAAPSQAGRVLARGLQDPLVWLRPGSIYVVAPSADTSGDDTIKRLSLNGRPEATGYLPGSLTSWPRLVLSGGSMWVTVWHHTGTRSGVFELIALGPLGLRVRHMLALRGPAGVGLAAAGGSVWVAMGRYLAKVSPQTGEIMGTVALPARTTDLASDSGGNLLVSARFGAIFALLNPSTGHTLASYKGGPGYGAQIAGVAEGQVFTWTGTGHSSSYERLDLAKGQFHSIYGWGYSPQLVVSGNRFLFNAYAGYGARARAPNYCGITATGKPLAFLPDAATPLQGRAVGYAEGNLYYLTTPRGSTETDLDEVSLPGCN